MTLPYRRPTTTDFSRLARKRALHRRPQQPLRGPKPQRTTDTGTTNQTQDAAGNLLTRSDARNQTRQTQYDALDSAIRNGQPNDFAALKKSAVAIRHICFNGQAAGKFAPQLQALGYRTVVLPSTSPANASWSFERKLAAWREALRG